MWEALIILRKLVNIMVADVLAPCVIRLIAAMFSPKQFNLERVTIHHNH